MSRQKRNRKVPEQGRAVPPEAAEKLVYVKRLYDITQLKHY